MTRMIFSQKAVYRLQQLANQVYRQSGVRHKLSQERDMLQMLRDSVFSPDPGVRRCYDEFVLELNKRQIDALTHQGVKIRPPGELSLHREAG